MQIQVVNDFYTTPINELRPGSIGIDHKGEVYARIYVPNPKEAQTQVFKLNDMSCQYNNHIDSRIRLRILEPDEKVVLTI